MENDGGLQCSSVSIDNKDASLKSWEHAWNVEEIRKNADQWSLAADVGLLEHMKEFASKITAQAHDVSKEVSQLLHDTRLTDSRIQSVTDYFLTLSDTQFIENRVYDEDATVDEKSDNKSGEKSKTREEHEAEMLPKLKEAVGFGVSVIADAYDVLDVAIADSDSDDDNSPIPTDEVILEPKDPYVTRPLPYLIGSRNFHQEDNVGVGDLLSGDDESEVGSLSESEEEVEKPPAVSDVSSSDYDTNNENESDDNSSHHSPVIIKDTKTLSASDDYSSSDDENISVNKKSTIVEDSSEVEIQAPKKHVISKKIQPELGIFDQSDDNDGDDLFSGSGSLFAKSGGLFDAPKSGLFDGVDGFSDSNNDDDKSLSESEKEAIPVSVKKSKPLPKKLPPGGVSLFGGAIKKGFFQGEDESEKSEEETISPTQVSQQKNSDLFADTSDDDESNLFSKKPPPLKSDDQSVNAAPPKSSGGLFNDSESDEGNLFNEVPPKDDQSMKALPPKSSGGLFNDSESDEGNLFNEAPPKVSPAKSRTNSGLKKPIGGVSMFGSGGGALQEAIRQRRPSSSSSATLQSHDSKPNSAINKSNKSTKKAQISLFDDFSDDEDDLFSSLSRVSIKDKSTAAKKQSTKKKSKLFADSSDEGDALFSTKVSSSSVSTRKDSSKSLSSNTSKKSQHLKSSTTKSTADPLFGDIGKPSLSNSPKKLVKSEKQKLNEKPRAFGSKSNLFNLSDSDSELFSSSTNRPTTLIQDEEKDDDDDDGLFTQKPPPTSTTANKLSVAKQPTKMPNLFNDSNHNKPEKAPTSIKVASKKKEKSLFDESDDDDDLFGGMTKTKPASAKPQRKGPDWKSEDLFADNRSTQKRSTVVKPSIATNKSKDLFDSDSDDEDLFKPKSSQPTHTTEQKIVSKVKSSSDEPRNSELSNKENNKIEESPKEIPKKKLPGAVSMFGAGGGDLLAAISKRRSPSQKSNISDKSNEPLQENKDVDVADKATPSSTANVTAKPFKPTSSSAKSSVSKVLPPASKSSGEVGKLQANLAINPTSLLPGAAPKISHTTDVDAPLETVTKTRSKGQAGRRPPTRRGRQKVVAQSETDFAVDSTANVFANTITPKLEPSAAETPTPTDIEPSQETNNIEKEISYSKNASKESTSMKKKAKLPSLFDEDDDLFGTDEFKKTDHLFSDDLVTKSKKEVNNSKLDFDLFGDDLDFEADSSLFNEKPSKVKSLKKPKLFDDDDLFADVDASKPGGDGKNSSAPFINGDTDDIFSTGTKKLTKKKTKKEATQLDVDDLFGDSDFTTKRSSKSKSNPKNLFDDDDDLFGDLTLAKTKQAKKNVVADPLFDDDDIFSQPSKVTKKPKSSSAKPGENLPDIFDDPLNALMGP